MLCPHKTQMCDTKVETVGAGVQCTHDCVCDLLEENELLKKALKQVMKLDMSDETKFTQTQLMLAVNEAKRIILEAWDDKNYFWKEDEK